MKPPPIGECLSKGWEVFKANPGAIIIGFLCAMVVGLIPIVGGFLATAGVFAVSLKALRGQKPEPKDGFIGFEAPVDHIVMGLLQICGLIACCIGVLFTQPLFLMGTPLITDKKMKWGQAKDACMTQVKPNLIPWAIFVFVMGLVAQLGIILCFVGVLVTAPVAVIGMAYAYEKSFGSAKA